MYCPTALAIIQCNTSSLTRHAKNYVPKNVRREFKLAKLPTAISTIGIDVPSYIPSNPEFNKLKLMKMIICTNLPFFFRLKFMVYGHMHIF